jgi:hypothetical protein
MVMLFFWAMAKKNPAAVELGRIGGSRRVPKGFSSMTEEERRAAAMKGVEARRTNAKRAAKRAAKTGAKP